MTTSCTDWKHPYYEQFFKKTFEQDKKLDFFLGEKKRHHMTFVSLGEALDFISIGGGNFVWWDLSTRGMVDFVKVWMDEQKPKIHYEKVPLSETSYTFKETKREHSYRWNSFDHDLDEELPYIDSNECFIKGHKRKIRDQGGRLRCAHVDIIHLKPSFVRKVVMPDLSVSYVEDIPFCAVSTSDGNYYDDEEDRDSQDEFDQELIRKYQKEMEKFEEEEPSFEVWNHCYKVLSDNGTYLPLETVLDRLNVRGMGIDSSGEGCSFPFSGFTVANYVKAWFNQEGERKFFRPEGVTDDYKKFSGFRAFSIDD